MTWNFPYPAVKRLGANAGARGLDLVKTETLMKEFMTAEGVSKDDACHILADWLVFGEHRGKLPKNVGALRKWWKGQNNA